MKVYWSRCGHGHGNFGDKITPLLLKHFGISVEWAPPEHAELIGVGSILEKAPENFKGIIWTTGFMNKSSRVEFSKARVLGVRGQLTLERINCPNRARVLVGDAGLLCDELTPLARSKYKLGIIPHFVDAQDPFVKTLAARSSDVRVIDICAEPSEVMRAVAECEKIVSSSLHGLILADSLRIPNRWLELNHGAEVVTGAGFKYRDYYSILKIVPEPLRITNSTTLEEVIDSIGNSPRVGLDQIKSSLRASISQIKEGMRPLSVSELREKQEAAAHWQQRLIELQKIIARTVPHNACAIVADEEQLRSTLGGLRSIPFLERDGAYWGPPGSAEEAIGEMQRHVRAGVTWFIIAWPMFWLLEKFPAFAEHLRRNFACRHESSAARIFEASEEH